MAGERLGHEQASVASVTGGETLLQQGQRWLLLIHPRQRDESLACAAHQACAFVKRALTPFLLQSHGPMDVYVLHSGLVQTSRRGVASSCFCFGLTTASSCSMSSSASFGVRNNWNLQSSRNQLNMLLLVLQRDLIKT